MGLSRLWLPLLDWLDGFVDAKFRSNADELRHARLIVNFGYMGGVFGLIYCCLYLTLEHYWGAAIVLICTVGLLAVAFSRFQNSTRAGNLIAFFLTFGFVGLAAVEGGVEGHAVGWLATIPISALVLANQRSGVLWLLVSLLGTAFFSAYYALGYKVPILYQMRWHPLITAIGYISLTLFAGILGFIIESGRKSAFNRMQLALDKLSEANLQLQALNKEKTDLLQVVAHDLRSPLQAVLGHGALIADGYLTALPEIQSSGGQIVKTSRRMSALIDNLLDLNAIEEGRFNLTIEKVDLSTMMRDAVVQHRFVAQKKDIQIETSIPEPPVFVLAAAQPTSQILDNLLSNAVKYSPRNTITVVTLQQRGEFAVVSVKDQGPGLSQADQALLFQKFTRLTSQPTGGESSSGLGLSIAKKMTESMGGTIGCQSELGEGATFFIELPLYRGA
ncbi:MAG TPA: HAMP domain-containing sensor histidine kinase [Chthoniobacterales bacterium]|jgi:signal transduction histidine kinase